AEDFQTAAGSASGRREHAAHRGIARDAQAETGEQARAFLVENLEGPQFLVLNIRDVDLFSADGDRARPDVVEALAQRHASANALVGVVLADAVSQIKLAREAVGLIENPRLGEANRSTGERGSGLERN